jgi:membrane protease YdiL (CAAX protease family)
MWRVKMFARFIVWLLKQALWGPMTIVAYLHVYIDNWKNECRNDFVLALLFYLLTVFGSIAGGLVGILIAYGDEATKQQLQSSMATSFYLGTGVFAFVILLASYDKFIEEYERSFTILKDKHDGQV